MRGLNLLLLLSILFIAPYTFAQIPSCPCDTTELPDGNLNGNEIVDILCPDGILAPGNDSNIDADQVLIAGPGSVNPQLVYNVFTPNGIDFTCTISDETGIGNVITVGLNSIEEYENCRERLIEGCSLLSIRNIPTLSEWGMIAMAGVLGIVGLYIASRRRKATA